MSEEGYEADEERNRYMIQTFCDEFSKSFDS